MEIKFLKPAPGVKIRDPRTKDFLPDDGRRVEAFEQSGGIGYSIEPGVQ